MDTADWTRPHIMREVPLTTLGSLYVNDKINKEEQKRQLRKASKSTYEMGRSIKFEETRNDDLWKISTSNDPKSPKMTL